MLVLTVQVGDVVEIDTPSGPIKIYFRLKGHWPPKFRTAFDAPRAWPIRHIKVKHSAGAEVPPAEPAS